MNLASSDPMKTMPSSLRRGTTFSPNSQGGGKRTTKGHYDVPMRDCTVTLDNDVIIEKGKFADEKMRVARVAR